MEEKFYSKLNLKNNTLNEEKSKKSENCTKILKLHKKNKKAKQIWSENKTGNNQILLNLIKKYLKMQRTIKEPEMTKTTLNQKFKKIEKMTKKTIFKMGLLKTHDNNFNLNENNYNSKTCFD